jgi:spore maturation protein CgeB
MRFLIVNTYYERFLNDLYAKCPQLESSTYSEQLDTIFEQFFGLSDAYSFYLRQLGHDACEIIVNADRLQQCWAGEHGLTLTGNKHDQRRQVAAAQIAAFQPDVLYVFEWCPLGDAFLASQRDRVGLVVGQIASPLHESRTYRGYDLLISSLPPMVNHFRRQDIPAETLALGFDPRVLKHVKTAEPDLDVTFVGGFVEPHGQRVSLLEYLIDRVPVEVFGYGLERVPAESSIHSRYRGPVWGLSMYETLQRSRITLNLHARIIMDDQTGTNTHANNMRLYEATGMGTCLLTDNKPNLGEIFESGIEVATFDSPEDCARRIQHLLASPKERQSIACAGHNRTLLDHTYLDRMVGLVEIVAGNLRPRNIPQMKMI